MGAADPTVCCDEPNETLGDGEDDDCDGLIDEGVLNECGQCGDIGRVSRMRCDDSVELGQRFIGIAQMKTDAIILT